MLKTSVAFAVWLLLVCAGAAMHGASLAGAKDLPIRLGTTQRHLLTEIPPSGPTLEPAADPFNTTASCRAVPSAATSRPDAIGRLWGWRNGASCAFKDIAGHVLFYSGYAPGSWLHTPACKSAPFSDSSVADSRYKVWGWETAGTSKHLCAYKSDRQQPIPIDKILYKLSWFDAPACREEPEPTADNSRPDGHQCLFGWQLDRNCAFKKIAEPLYYPGYNGTCNTTGDLTSTDMVDNLGAADDFGAAEAQTAPSVAGPGSTPVSQITDDSANDTPGAVTSVGLIRQKAPEKVLADDVIRQLFGKGSSADLNKTLHISSGDDALTTDTSTDGGGLVQDTPVPVAFDSDTSPSAPSVSDQPIAEINTELSPSPEAVPQSTTAPTGQLPPAALAPAALMPTNSKVATYNITSDGAVISDTPVPVVFAEPSNSSVASHTIRHLQGVEEVFPKPKANEKTVPTLSTGDDLQPSDWSDGGPGGLAPPRHQSRSTILRTPLLPEHQAQALFGAAELDAVVHKPVPESVIPEPTWDEGPGGISLPHPRSTAGRQIRLAAVKPITITAADGASASQESAEVLGQPGPAHTMDTDPADSSRLRAIPATAAVTDAKSPPAPKAPTVTAAKQSLARKFMPPHALRRLTSWLARHHGGKTCSSGC